VLRADYSAALERRLAWLRWATHDGVKVWGELGYGPAMPAYLDVLDTADTFCMTPKFAELVDVARASIPGETQYEPTWLQAPRGFCWLPRPFRCPSLDLSTFPPEQVASIQQAIAEGRLDDTAAVKVRAVGWRPVAPGMQIRNQQTGVTEEIATAGATQFLFFQDFNDIDASADHRGRGGFGCWSYLVVRPGERLDARIAHFEASQASGKYSALGDRRAHPLHELRWLYAALHLMAQRLAHHVKEPADRATRRRIARTPEAARAVSLIRVVSLRRLEEDRKADPAGHEVDWQWKWWVRGHWRTVTDKAGQARQIFIEKYAKGPEDKPWKPDQVKIFAAER